MRLGNTPRQETPFFVDANKSFAFGILFEKADGTPYNLMGMGARLVIADSSGSEVVNVVNDAVDLDNGHIQFNLQAEDLALDPGTYPYDITLTPLEGYTVPLLTGSFEVEANVDLDTSNTYTQVMIAPSIIIVMDIYTVLRVKIGVPAND